MIAELVGPAGAGKSILTERLSREPGALRASIWKLPRAQWVISAIRSLPTLVALCISTRSLPWEDLRHIIRLGALHRVLQRQRAAGARLVLLDEGPVFALAWLQVYGQDRLRHAAMAAWWRDTAREWARALDTIVLLDAPDPVLAGRMRGRAQAHSMKQKSDADIARFSAAYRTAFERVVAALRTAEEGHVRIVTLHSDGESVDHVAARLLKLLEANGN
jgi:predicted ATPase